MREHILELTVEDLGQEATELDLQAFQTACRNYLAAIGGEEADAIAAIWGNGDFWPRVRQWALGEAEAAEAYDRVAYAYSHDDRL